jgi:hypothetical protein
MPDPVVAPLREHVCRFVVTSETGVSELCGHIANFDVRHHLPEKPMRSTMYAKHTCAKHLGATVYYLCVQRHVRKVVIYPINPDTHRADRSVDLEEDDAREY